MEWTAQSFIERVLRHSEDGLSWWTELAGEVRQARPSARYIYDTLMAELASEIPEFRRRDRRLYFFSSHAAASIDGRAGSVGVEEKSTDLTFPSIIDGAIHRGVVWVLGNPQRLLTPEAVSLCVVRRGVTPMAPMLSDAVARVIGALATIEIHVVFIQDESGQHWGSPDAIARVPMPGWLATKSIPASWQLPAVDDRAVAELKSVGSNTGPERSLFDRRSKFREYRGITGVKLASVDWSNEWQMIEIGLLLRALGYDAGRVTYRGSRALVSAGRGIERNVQTEMSRRFGVVLDWGVPLER